MTDKPWFDWSDYSDVGRVLELGVLFDDVLKKNDYFLNYSVLLANRICEDLGLNAKITWGKWGGRLEPVENPHLKNEASFEKIAKAITEHPSWKALMESTRVFTFGKSREE